MGGVWQPEVGLGFGLILFVMSGSEDGLALASPMDSDLIGAELAAALGVWFLVVLAAFFFVGPVVGIVVILLGVILFGWWAVNAIRRSEQD